MFWTALSVAIILALAWGMRQATINTPFDCRRACVPDIKHLEYMEKKEKTL